MSMAYPRLLRSWGPLILDTPVCNPRLKPDPARHKLELQRKRRYWEMITKAIRPSRRCDW
jgi:hypothetical protein